MSEAKKNIAVTKVVVVVGDVELTMTLEGARALRQALTEAIGREFYTQLRLSVPSNPWLPSLFGSPRCGPPVETRTATEVKVLASGVARFDGAV